MADNFNFDIPVIDSRDDETLYQQAVGVTSNASRGQLNDFSDNGPLATLLQGLGFSIGELLYRVNQLPVVAIYELMKLTNIERREGTKSRVTLEFTLSISRNQPTTINQGTEVRTQTGGKSFFTTEQLVIPANETTGTVSAIAKEIGSDYNVGAFTITKFIQPLTFLQSVTNRENAQGGSDQETIDDYLDRVQASLRIRNVTTDEDFERAAESIMGVGSRAKSIGALDGERRPLQAGNTHVFCLAREGEPANQALLTEISTTLNGNSHSGVIIHVSPMELRDITVEVTAKVTQGFNFTDVSDSLYQSFRNYLSPLNFSPGDGVLLSELAFALRNTPGVSFIDEFILNGSDRSVALEKWELPFARSLKIFLVDSNQNRFETSRGDLDDLG